jgi:hypothetical protein
MREWFRANWMKTIKPSLVHCYNDSHGKTNGTSLCGEYCGSLSRMTADDVVCIECEKLARKKV